MNQEEFRKNCKCTECEYMSIRPNISGDDMEVCSKIIEVIEDIKKGNDKCRYTK